jgi:hypothetical protein
MLYRDKEQKPITKRTIAELVIGGIIAVLLILYT